MARDELDITRMLLKEGLTSHRNIVNVRMVTQKDKPESVVIDTDETGDLHYMHYIVYDLCNAGDLEEYSIKLQQRFDEPTSLFWFRQLMEGLSFLHRRQMAHCDLKLENLMLSVDPLGHYILKIGDFGMSKVLNNNVTGDSFFQRNCKSFMSTPNYMAPEWGLAEALYKQLQRCALTCTLFCKALSTTFDPIAADMWACGVIPAHVS